MGLRNNRISRSIVRAIFRDPEHQQRSLLARILSLFALFQLALTRFNAAVFKKLRNEVWGLDEEEYRESFRSGGKKGGLNPVGDLGYSGSTFFTTPNSKFLIKSLPRRFEHTFFTNDLFLPYTTHMQTHPSSLLVRITDFLCALHPSIGSILGTAPAHHVVMENVLYGKDSDSQSAAWETYDLKPASYFYPERDIADGRLASDSVKERLVDTFPDKIRLTRDEFEELMYLLKVDTGLLASANAVDYSLFLVRYPNNPSRSVASLSSAFSAGANNNSNWRTGVVSADRKWVYRAVVLDFFWAKHKAQAMAMTGLIRSFNVFAGKGDMSITTDPDEYKERFLSMVKGYVEVVEEGGSGEALRM
ncbi:SAICAR synthase-like protein [Saccharata proteae CBS 121410]|uniref:SAICAR synthase-like protein n=1 Tax=Saccharata proteae CBS 121410 TaxID=1314787 RepID=A0A9P4HPN3_9PEZI|nr:SAICAR synthase-like protein [Saccharata proteae CBS 121410]